MACAFSEENQNKAENAVLNALPASKRTIETGGSIEPSKFQEVYDIYMGNGNPDTNSLDLSHITPFRRRVYELLLEIPKGRVTTYGAIAQKIGSRRHARAVGTAVGNNPLSLVVPCHRVVPSTMTVGNYGMPDHEPSEGYRVKQALLKREGVKFEGEKITNDSLWTPR